MARPIQLYIDEEIAEIWEDIVSRSGLSRKEIMRKALGDFQCGMMAELDRQGEISSRRQDSLFKSGRLPII